MNLFSSWYRHASRAAIVCLFGASLVAAPARAVPYTEVGDAGDLPATAQVVYGTAGTTLSSIIGTLTLTSGVSEGDMYRIYINAPSTFSASTAGFAPGFNNFDTQLFLFTVGGLGLLTNDDDPSGGSQSTLRAGSLTLAAGFYDLLITGYGRNPASAGGEIFPNSASDPSVDSTGTYGPTGPGGGMAISTYSGNSSEGGRYSIALTGAQFVAPLATVPEPSTIAIFFSGLAIMLVVIRRSRLVPSSNVLFRTR